MGHNRHEPPYIVIPYLDGGTLADVLAQKRLPLEEVSYLVRQVGSALDYAHRQGVVHRDMKPSNVIVDRDGNVFVSDFGLVRMVAGPGEGKHLPTTQAIIGSPAYMSPEQAQDIANIDHRADIYALGVILFELLTGELPYEDGDPLRLVMKHLQEPIPSAVGRNPKLPPGVDPVIVRALAKDPGERYTSAAALTEAVIAVLGEGVRSSPPVLRQAARDSVALRHLTPRSVEKITPETPSEQNKSVTALYANAAEYAELVDEAQGVEAARGALRTLWEAAREIVNARGGMLISQTEETLLALWGVETAREDDAERAIRAALDLHAFLQEQKTEIYPQEEEGESSLLDIGIHTGLALITVPKSPSPGERQGKGTTARGATLRLASQLAGQAAGDILITHAIYNQVRGVFTMEPDSPLRERRGRGTIPIYRVLAAKPRAFRVQAPSVEGVETGMIGREGELKSLQNAFLDALEDGETQVVTVVGQAGLGKSRLLFEFASWADLRPEVFWLLRARATPEMRRRPYALLRNLLSFRYELLDSDSPALVRQKLEAGIADQIGAQEANEETAHMLGHLAGFDFSDSPHIKGLLDDPEQLANRAKLLFKRWVVNLCAVGPVVFELEDIHHADEPSLDLLNDLVSEHEELPVLLVCTARPALYERRPTWGSGQPFHTRLELKPLDRRASRALVREVLQKVDRVPKMLRDPLVERAEGNPFYLEELVKMLIDDRVIIKDSPEAWRVEETRLGHLSVPGTLAGLLQTRLDSLLYPEKLTLQRAAVVGRVFYDRALVSLDAADKTHLDDLPGILEKLVKQEFIYPREASALEGSVEYIFASTMLRDALLETLLHHQRETYNRAAAGWLVEASGEWVGEYNALIAAFYEQGGEHEKAADYLRQAGERSLAISAYGEARTGFARALSMLPEGDPGEALLQLRLGQANYYLGNYSAAREALETALAAFRERNDDPHTADALSRLGGVAIDEGDYPQAQAHLETALSIARAGGDSGTLARTLSGMGSLHWTLGDYETARRYFEESLELARQIGDTRLELLALGRLGTVAGGQGDLDEAQRYHEEALVLAQRVGDRGRAATALNNLGVVADERSDHATAVVYYRQAIATSRETGQRSSTALFLSSLAEALLSLGDLAAVQEPIYEGLALGKRVGAIYPILSAVRNAGLLLAKAGELQRGLALIGLSLHHPGSHSENKRLASEALADLGLDLEDPAVAEALEAGKDLDLDTVARELLAELGKA